MSELEHEVRCAFSELRGDDSQRNNAIDGLAEAGISRENRVVIVSICDGAKNEDQAVDETKTRLPFLFSN